MANPNQPRDLLTIPGLALSLNVPERLIRTALERGVIVSCRGGRLHLFDPAQLVDLRQALVTAGLITPLGSPLRHLVPSLPQTA